jgi:hypothetical protein
MASAEDSAEEEVVALGWDQEAPEELEIMEAQEEEEQDFQTRQAVVAELR